MLWLITFSFSVSSSLRVNVCQKQTRRVNAKSVTLKITCPKSSCHLVTSNCCRVCICVCVYVCFFCSLLNTGMGNQWVLSLSSLAQGSMFCFFCCFFCMTRNGRGGEERKGRVVIVLCFSLRRTFLNPVASGVWAACCPPATPKSAKRHASSSARKPEGDVHFVFNPRHAHNLHADSPVCFQNAPPPQTPPPLKPATSP